MATSTSHLALVAGEQTDRVARTGFGGDAGGVPDARVSPRTCRRPGNCLSVTPLQLGIATCGIG